MAFWMILLQAVKASILLGTRAEYDASPESHYLEKSWRQVIPGVWYTETPLSHNPPQKEEPQNYQSPKKPSKPQVFCPLASAFLLSSLGAYFFLGCFNPLLGCYCLFRELFHLGMVSLPVGSLVTVLNPSEIIHHLGRLLSSGWVPDMYPSLSDLMAMNSSCSLKKVHLEDLPANISYNTQGALNESPLDVSNIMN
ncbi:hypothetical protein DSO57_1008025 [Entomophthora muscae]|uniref:Uncharacterized protein n=1 Tax=Entomophthora muscae TaxID=34485 RepID=A0ACC2UTI6_9FUNG|nr:hypothetical protein DSO57_1008025 [Entomophthora muscae]